MASYAVNQRRSRAPASYRRPPVCPGQRLGRSAAEGGEENAFSTLLGRVRRWHLGLTEARRRDQGAYAFVYGDFRRVHRMADRLRVPGGRVATQGRRAGGVRPAAAPRREIGLGGAHPLAQRPAEVVRQAIDRQQLRQQVPLGVMYARNASAIVTPWAGRSTTSTASPPRTSPGVTTRRYAPGRLPPRTAAATAAPASWPGTWRTECAERGLQLQLVPDPPLLPDHRPATSTPPWSGFPRRPRLAGRARPASHQS